MKYIGVYFYFLWTTYFKINYKYIFKIAPNGPLLGLIYRKEDLALSFLNMIINMKLIISE